MVNKLDQSGSVNISSLDSVMKDFSGDYDSILGDGEQSRLCCAVILGPRPHYWGMVTNIEQTSESTPGPGRDQASVASVM